MRISQIEEIRSGTKKSNNENGRLDDRRRRKETISLVQMCKEWTEMNSRNEEWNGYFQGDEREEDQQHVAVEGDK